MKTVFYLITRIEKNKFFRKQTIIACLLYLFFFLSTNNVPIIETSRSAAEVYNPIVAASIAAVYLFLLIGCSRNTFAGLASKLKYFRATPLSDMSIIIYSFYEKIRPILVSLIFALIALWNVLHKMLSIPHSAILILYLGSFLCGSSVALIASAISTVSTALFRVLYRLLMLLPGVFVLLYILNNTVNLNGIARLFFDITLNDIYFVPILGWNIGFVISLVSRQYLSSLFYLVLLLITIAGPWMQLRKHRNYVIERAFLDIISKRQRGSNYLTSQVFVLPPWCAIYERKRVSLKRRGKKTVFNIGTWVVLIATIILGIGISQSQNEVGDIIPAEYALLISALMGSIFTLCLFANDIEWSELGNPFFRLIPIGIVGKFLNIYFSLYIRCFVIGIISLCSIGLYNGSSLFTIAMTFLSFMSLNFVFSCGQIISYKLFGIVDDIMISENIKMILNLVIIIPSVAIYIALLLLGYTTAICTVVFVCVNAAVGFISIYYSRGVLA